MKFNFLKQFKKKEKEHVLPQRKPKKILSYKKVQRFILGFSAFFILFFIVGTIRVFMVSNNISSLHKQIKVLNEKVEHLQMNKNDVIDDKLFNFFMGDFLKQYFTLSKDSEALKSRNQALLKYYAKGVEQSKIDNVGTREFKSSTLISLQKDKDAYKAIYQVVYYIGEIKEKERKKEDGNIEKYADYEPKEIVNYIVVPFNVNAGQFSIIQEPYFVAKPSVFYTNEVKSLFNLNGQRINDVSIEKELTIFLNTFFPKYFLGNIEDLKYMMLEPVGLDNRFNFTKIDQVEFIKGADENSYQALVKVIFTEKGTTFKYGYKLDLMIVKKDSKYMIQSLKFVN